MEHYEQYELLDAVYWIDFYCEVADKATKLGYSIDQVEMFWMISGLITIVVRR